MTNKQKAAFLENQKWWKTQGLWTATNHPFYMIDEAYAIAYRIAKRRKAQREARALRKAGWEYGECIAYGFGWFDDTDLYRAKTSGEAIKILEARKK